MFSVLNRIGRVQGDEKIDQKKNRWTSHFLKPFSRVKGVKKLISLSIIDLPKFTHKACPLESKFGCRVLIF